MTDLKKLKYAQSYMLSLANGADPVSAQPLPQDTCLGKIHLSRCFSFIADILKELLENDGQVQLPERHPFIWSDDLKSHFIITAPPVQIMEFLKPLNDHLTKRYMEKVPPTVITEWLVEQGYLSTITTSNLRRSKRPTPDGNHLDITTEQRNGLRGPYTAILYSASAQRFIVEHFKDIAKRWKNGNKQSVSSE